MALKPTQFYCRLIALLIIGYVVLQICSFHFMSYPGMKQEEKLVHGTIDISFSPFVKDFNNAQLIFNERKFGPLENSSIVIVIQVHEGASHLLKLIERLSRAKGISEALLIVSHDIYDTINEYVLDIDFCKVMQMYYPHSIQMYPNQFPGTDPKDCPRNISKLNAIIKHCNNALNPDLYGRYRVAEYTQKKHHWWWIVNRVFRKLKKLNNFTGLVLFLEEDYIVSEDFLYVLKKMQEVGKKFCADCNIFSLGNNFNALMPNSKRDSNEYSKVQYTAWSSEQHSVAVAFNASTWSDIHSCAETFCTYDDFNWDRSLEHVAEKCMERSLNVFVVKKSRVYSTRNWSKLNITKMEQEFSLASYLGQLYPATLKISSSILKSLANQPSEIMKSGDWSDPRDHLLCLNSAYA